MHQRLHERNNKKLSIIGISLANLSNFNGNFDYLAFNNLLQSARNNKINFMSIPYNNKEMLSSLLSWESDTRYTYTKSILLNTSNFDLIKQLQDLVEAHNLSQIDFLSLIYTTKLFKNLDELNELITRAKETNNLNSVGLHCSSLTDALLVCKKVTIDHIEIKLEINSSLELLNSIFKIASKKKIAVFCFLNSEYQSTKNNIDENLDPLQALLDQGRDTVHEKILKALELLPEDFLTLALRRYLELDFQSILVNNVDFSEENFFLKALTHPYLTNEEHLAIQNSLQPYTYESPKNK